MFLLSSMDPWRNRVVESQAYNLVHCLGQKHKVQVYSFVMEGPIEECMVMLQSAKAALGNGSMEKLTPIEERRAKLTAIEDIFEIVEAKDAYELKILSLTPKARPVPPAIVQ